jgi:hypothetical protein
MILMTANLGVVICLDNKSILITKCEGTDSDSSGSVGTDTGVSDG